MKSKKAATVSYLTMGFCMPPPPPQHTHNSKQGPTINILITMLVTLALELPYNHWFALASTNVTTDLQTLNE